MRSLNLSKFKAISAFFSLLGIFSATVSAQENDVNSFDFAMAKPMPLL